MKRILVTGGSRGLGLAICSRLLQHGCSVITCARSESAAAGKLARKFPGSFEFHQIDLSTLDGVMKLARQARLADGVSGFVANAAAGLDGLLLLTPPNKIEQCIRFNLTSTIWLTREVVKGMMASGGTLIFISSVAAAQGIKGLAAYSAAKGALVSFSRSIAREYGERGIRSNCILPGFMETKMNRSLNLKMKKQIRRRAALRRFATVSEVADIIAFLLSDSGRSITGTEIVVDGGFST